MKRRALWLLLALAFGAGLHKAAQRPPVTAFREAQAVAASHERPRVDSRFVSSRLHTQTHAASLVELQDGRLRAFWFSGSREGAPDVEIHSAVFDPVRGQWGAEQKVIDRGSTQQALLRYIAKLGNPVAGRAADGSLWLYYVTVSVGGWAGSSITAMRSTDEGETWGAPQRLITSPFLNVSTLVRNAPFLYGDGTLGIPVYHEFVSKFGELLRLDQNNALIDKQRLTPGGSGALQPVLLAHGPRAATVLMRYSGPPPHRAVSVATTDSGQHWSAPEKSPLPNPDSALSAIVLADGRWLAALNNVEQGRDVFSLMVSADQGATWNLIHRLEDQRGQPLAETAYLARASTLLAQSDDRIAQASTGRQKEFLASVRQQACTPQGCRYEFSYPFLLQARSGDVHLVYTWNRTFIKHVRFTPAWLEQQAERAR